MMYALAWWSLGTSTDSPARELPEAPGASRPPSARAIELMRTGRDCMARSLSA